ncbi:hypothetical protein IAQ67_14250 [Paenibacillus peoriae]|uniref:HTH cro/C1-type domain-containing protein n=1 Tax=Paenibacillus peoriae TaxID=59893 RepID=A0A7H0Y1Y1_9BACL|nr:hypothetical protein [Paenibacillus peoriae]QNR65089.1 hypothetical protein IAQ67_14250 [Paenibacillus peoriae]
MNEKNGKFLKSDKTAKKRLRLVSRNIGTKKGTEPQKIVDYESMDKSIMPNIDILIKLSKVFDVSTDYLLGLNDTDYPNNQAKILSAEKYTVEFLKQLVFKYKIDLTDTREVDMLDSIFRVMNLRMLTKAKKLVI